MPCQEITQSYPVRDSLGDPLCCERCGRDIKGGDGYVSKWCISPHREAHHYHLGCSG